MKSIRFPLLCVTLILLTPRVNIIAIGGSTIRLEDVLFLLNALWLSLFKRSKDNFSDFENKIIKTVIYISVLGVISTFLAVALGRNSLVVGLLYALRPLEYASIVPTIFLLSRTSKDTLQKLPLILTIVIFLPTITQEFFKLQIGTDRFGFSRNSALTGGHLNGVLVC